jgi:glycine cleavage system regulatory protein
MWALVAVWTLVAPIADCGCSPLAALLSMLGSRADMWTLVAVWTLVALIADCGCSPLVALLSMLGSRDRMIRGTRSQRGLWSHPSQTAVVARWWPC